MGKGWFRTKTGYTTDLSREDLNTGTEPLPTEKKNTFAKSGGDAILLNWLQYSATTIT